MRGPRVKKPKAADLDKVWRQVIGEYPYTVTVQERKEHKLRIELRYNDPAKVAAGARDPRTWRPTRHVARTKLGEKPNPDVLALALKEAREFELKLRTSAGTPTAAVGSEPALGTNSEARREPLTLAEGIRRAMSLDGTGYLSCPLDRNGRPTDRVVREIIARSRVFLRIWRTFEQETGRTAPTWDSFTPVDADYVVRRLAKEHARDGSYGYSVAEKMLDEVYRTARWLREQQLIDHDSCVPRDRWKVAAKKEWEKIAGALKKPSRPRHTAPELRALFAALDDPRGYLALKLHHGARLALFADRRRSDLRLDRTAAHPHGGVLVHEGPSNSYVRGFTDEQRALIDEALSSGYLRRYEAARIAGDVKDYWLFPDGPLVTLPDEPSDLPPSLMPSLDANHFGVTGPNVLTIDPRHRLAIELAPALRLGQVIRTMRSQVNLEADWLILPDENDLATSVETVDVRGRGNKQSPGVALNDINRRALYDAFAGYLSAFEGLYRAGKIEDYPLFPQGRLQMGIADPSRDSSKTPATPDAARGWFREHEAAAGVESVKGRVWYGLRRVLTDEAPKVTSNEKTLKTLFGTSAEMRMSVYQDAESLESKLDAARVAAEIRTGGRVAGTTPTPSALMLQPGLARALSVYTAEEIEFAISVLESRRAGRRAVQLAQQNGAESEEKTEFVDPMVDPNAKARIQR